jgi:hypothetical protein
MSSGLVSEAGATNGVQDRDGSSGSFGGHLFEARLRLALFPGNLGLELGAAHLFAGEVLTAHEPPVDDTSYGYLQTTITF